MARIIFAGSAGGTTAQLDSNFSDLYQTFGGGYRLGYIADSDVFTVGGSSYANYGLTSLAALVGLSGYSGLALFTASVARLSIDGSGNISMFAPSTPPALAVNQTIVINLTSNTNLRISARGSDGVTRVANITLA